MNRGAVVLFTVAVVAAGCCRFAHGQSKNGGDMCSSFGDELICGQNNRCVWCRSKAVPNSCLEEMHASSLPKSVFSCNFKAVDSMEKLALTKGEIFSSLHIAPFTPTTSMGITCGKSMLVLGKAYAQSVCASELAISFVSPDDGLYSVALVDLDAPEPQFIHMFYVNVKGSKNKKVTVHSDHTLDENGHTLMSFFAPSPPLGVHRYAALVAHQQSAITAFPKLSRPGFDIAAFLDMREIKPVSLTYFAVTASKFLR
jgi:phosphatidylethanolamine-binding protein (PEBP) family uncharacterized protein